MTPSGRTPSLSLGLALALSMTLPATARAQTHVIHLGNGPFDAGGNPVASPAHQAATDDTGDAPPVYGDGADVVSWKSLPRDRRIALTRATFSRNGYLLATTGGQQIAVTFTNNDLYVMKFARSLNDEMYFEILSGAPVLYVPQGGYLANSDVDGARWYPFNDQFAPARPVYDAPAPNWQDYYAMPWTPDESYYGGYYSSAPTVYPTTTFLESPGLVVIAGGSVYNGFPAYYRYYHGLYQRGYHYNPYAYPYTTTAYGSYHGYGNPYGVYGLPTVVPPHHIHPGGRPGGVLPVAPVPGLSGGYLVSPTVPGFYGTGANRTGPRSGTPRDNFPVSSENAFQGVPIPGFQGVPLPTVHGGQGNALTSQPAPTAGRPGPARGARPGPGPAARSGPAPGGHAAPAAGAVGGGGNR